MTDPKGKRMTAEELLQLTAFDVGDPSTWPEAGVIYAAKDHIAALEAEITSLREERDGFEADYLRRHKDACDLKDKVLTLTRPPSDEGVAAALDMLAKVEIFCSTAKVKAVRDAIEVCRRLAQANKTAREEALEEAAVICDAWAKTEPQPALGSDEPTPTTRAIASICRDVGTKCAAAIRALKSSDETKI